jgi:type I restriction enzyme, S subunit
LTYCLARSETFREFAIQSMTGSSGRQRVPEESLRHYLLSVPSEPQIAHRFGALVRPLFARASASTRESRALAALRDALLPKFMSGELRVTDAEKFGWRTA